MANLIRAEAYDEEAEITDLETEGFGLAFSLTKLRAGGSEVETTPRETAWLLLQGELTFRVGDESFSVARSSLFDELPYCLHVPAGTEVDLRASSAVELARFEIDNDAAFPVRLYRPEDVRDEPRGKGGLQDAAFRYVRTIIDDVAGPAEAKLVLGEVVTLPGRWSSYPPHHHPQPEIYHYRFTRPEGYGHAEQGDDVHKVKDGDTLLIPPGQDHAQCAAPGYGMWYAWAIRHLDDERYTVPEFTAEHAWTLERDATHWWPRDVD